MKRTIYTDKAPEPIGPYSQAVIYAGLDELIYTSGQIPIDPKTSNITDGDISAQTRQVMENLNAVLEKAGSSFDKIIKTTVYLTDMSKFAEFNKVYETYFSKDCYPARTCVEVSALPKGAAIEIEAVACAGRIEKPKKEKL